jgi:hypothetical protein
MLDVQVIDQELAVALQAAGVPQECLFRWIMRDDGTSFLWKWDPISHMDDTAPWVAAFTLGELITLLGDEFRSLYQVGDQGYLAFTWNHLGAGRGQTPQHAVGRLLLDVWTSNHDA